MKLKPLGARVLLKPTEPEVQTASGIVLPDTAKTDQQTAEVISTGDHEDVKVSIGEVVVYRKFSGTEVKIEGDEHIIVDAEDILGVIESEGQQEQRGQQEQQEQEQEEDKGLIEKAKEKLTGQ